MNIISLIKQVLPLVALLFCLSVSSQAEDTEIYVGNGATDSDGVRPNVLFMLDTSSSMYPEDDGTGVSRLDRMKEALRIIINQSNNVNMGLMRFHKEGGPVLYPVKNINEAVEAEGVDSDSDLVIQVVDSADDAEESVSSGEIILDDTRLEMTAFSTSATDFSTSVSYYKDDAEERVSNGSLDRGSSDLDVWLTSIGGGWDNGWTIFSDIDGDATLDDDGDALLCETGEDCEIKRREALENASFSTTPVSWPRFNSRGQIDQSYSLVYRPSTCPTGEDKEFRILISAFGRVSVTRGACP